MNKCKDCQADLILRSSRVVSEEVSQQTYWCSACKSQQIQSVLTIPGAAFDLSPYSHYQQMREYSRTAAELDPVNNGVSTWTQHAGKKSA